jgi:hypothetical protein
MRYRNVYIRKEGESMQRRNVGKAMSYLVAIMALISAFALVACGGDDGDDEIRTVSNQSVPVDSNNVQAAVGQQFTFSNGAIFGSGIANNQAATFTFTTPTTFSLASGGSTASGDVAFGSCILTVRASNFPAGRGPQVGTVITFTTCSFQLNAGNVTTGGAAVSGTLTLILSGPTGSGTSLAITVQISILDDGTLVINGIETDITAPSATGTTGAGGQ